MKFETDHPPSDPIAPMNSPVGSGSHLGRSDSAHVGIMPYDFYPNLYSQNINVEYPISNSEGSYVELFLTILDMNLDVNDAYLVELGPISSPSRATSLRLT